MNLANIKGNKHQVDEKYNNKHYDVIVIGGGSGGISFCYEAQKLGMKTILFDYVEKSTQGSAWGLGGTCVNVGCIPKKLFHTASLLKENFELSKGYGFDLGDYKFDWDKLTQQVQLHIKKLNFGYKKELALQQIPYINAYASFKDQNTVVYSSDEGAISNFLADNKFTDKKLLGQITADSIIVATGGRPTLLSDTHCKNMQKYAITSDDIFSLKQNPGKTLVIGGGYIALECAGFLQSLGYPVTSMTRGMDRQVADMITDHLRNDVKVNIVDSSLPYDIQKVGESNYSVKWQNQENKDIKGEQEYNTILAAIGRTGNTRRLNLKSLNIQMNQSSQKIVGGYHGQLECSSTQGVYAIGDVLHGVPELTPVAQKMARNLVKILYQQKQKKNLDITNIKYDTSVPTTVFTPLEYGFLGLSEEQAIKEHGEENIEIYLSKLSPLEEQLHPNSDKQKTAFFKVICLGKDEKIIGMHYLGPNAGEVIQGYSVAFNIGYKKSDLDQTIGIHPTNTEEFVNLKVTKRSGENFEKSGC